MASAIYSSKSTDSYTNTFFIYICVCFIGLVGYTIWKFYIKRDVKNDLEQPPRARKQPVEQHENEETEEEGTAEEDEVEEVDQRSKLRNSNPVVNDGVHHRTNAKHGSAGL